MPSSSLKHAIVIGLGISGMAAVRLLKSQGCRVTGMDERAGRSDYQEIPDAFIPMICPETLLGADLIILSPGVDPRRPELEKARQKKIPVIGELALGLRQLTLPFVAITGTNGKSTVTELVGAMLTASGKKVFTGGNLGLPLCDFVLQGCPADIAVLEVSSFQLDTLESFTPDVAVLLNISPDHLDRYPDMAAYATSKARIFKDMKKGIAVLNHKDPTVRAIGEKLSLTTHWYDREKDGTGIREKGLILENGKVLDLSHFPLPGRHNLENLAAALLTAKAAGATEEGMEKAIGNFCGLEHRMTPVGSIRGIPCYDDSKATNMDAVCRALSAFKRDVVLIMGGRDKGGDYRAMEESVRRYARSLILMGEAADAIEQALGHMVPCRRAKDMEDAVKKAVQAADSQTPILLSPACSSFDMFRDYKDRGMQFRRAVVRFAAEEVLP
ncbi:UDP-N-acetylmuramoylalanine--D-glutamate ligase [Desulfobotulus alkaliphilus]|uniref:UDP-N-acetylmuramoylalanine--D-glutamate ligase n=1 Tax=Desulfobotulus alkaliphilus TaxID=622671 RepID=A0A562RIE5_9BACT|nr:UDP-N-acetylmuramoyl-L-alanine--D-glutamate ligase [Desulfobotulus alkaliphilus]TWI68096.1 UDP-N-acetylmuramoylalanine--D-glutamate ligase [Desulfobotulus alkaliphilus]